MAKRRVEALSSHPVNPVTPELESYLNQFKPRMMQCFARFVISQGRGGMAPTHETWQACGERLFGSGFRQVFLDEIGKMERS